MNYRKSDRTNGSQGRGTYEEGFDRGYAPSDLQEQDERGGRWSSEPRPALRGSSQDWHGPSGSNNGRGEEQRWREPRGGDADYGRGRSSSSDYGGSRGNADSWRSYDDARSNAPRMGGYDDGEELGADSGRRHWRGAYENAREIYYGGQGAPGYGGQGYSGPGYYAGQNRGERGDAGRGESWRDRSYGDAGSWRSGLGGGSRPASMNPYGWSEFDAPNSEGGWRSRRGSSGSSSAGRYGSSANYGSSSGYGSSSYGSSGYGSTSRSGGSQGSSDWRSEGTSFAGRGPKGYRRNDERIQEEISENLKDHDELDASEIEVSVQNGTVTLSGSVSDRRSKRLAEQCCEDVSGVEDVTNLIRVSSSRSGERSGESSSSKTSSSNASNDSVASGSTSKASGQQQRTQTTGSTLTSSSNTRS